MKTDLAAANKSRAKARKLVKTIHPFIRPDQHVHHLDKNPLNNDIENLCVLPRSFHLSYHNLGSKKPQRPRPEQTKLGNLSGTLNILEKTIFFYNECIWF